MQVAFQDSRRESRRKVLLRARMRAGAASVEVCIRDVSGYGLLVQAAAPPFSGSYVEIVHGRYSIVGRVRWAGERRFGILASHRIDIDALLGETQRRDEGFRLSAVAAPACAGPVAERRQDPDRARRASRAMQFLAFLFFGFVATAAMAGIVYKNVAGSMGRVTAALRP